MDCPSPPPHQQAADGLHRPQLLLRGDLVPGFLAEKKSPQGRGGSANQQQASASRGPQNDDPNERHRDRPSIDKQPRDPRGGGAAALDGAEPRGSTERKAKVDVGLGFPGTAVAAAAGRRVLVCTQ